MRLVSAEGALLIDEIAHEEFNIPEKALIQEAGSRMARIISRLPATTLEKGVIVVAGPGNNGGDGRVIAKRISQLGIEVEVLTPEQYYNAGTDKWGVIVDAIFGVGLNRPIEGFYKDAIGKINTSKATVVSIDIPSGLNATSGRVLGSAVKADLTIMVSPMKTGAFLRDGPDHCGKIVSIHISFPQEVIARIAREYFLLNTELANSWIPKRDAKFNKSKFGHAYLVAGSEGKWGAAVLSARSAFRAGVGYVVHTSPDAGNILNEVPEAMSVAFDKLLQDVSAQKQVGVAIGPGSGFSPELVRLMLKLRTSSVPVVLDADALTLLSQHPMKLRPDWIITPHSGELSRLLNVPVDEIESDPLAAAKSASRKFGCTVVLKGYYTIVTSGYSGRTVIVPRGNVALAKAGTGDVLTGLILGFLAQGIHPVKAALLGVYVHGSAADEWVKENSNASMSASDLIDRIPKTIKSLEARHG